MTETQETVAAWADAEFPGADPASPRGALRALEEVVELCRAAGASWEEIEKAAGVFRGAAREGYSSRAPEPAKVPAEAADALITLYVVAGRRGFDLHAEVDRKMAVNRGRVWAPRGDGTGYHVKGRARCLKCSHEFEGAVGGRCPACGFKAEA